MLVNSNYFLQWLKKGCGDATSAFVKHKVSAEDLIDVSQILKEQDRLIKENKNLRSYTADLEFRLRGLEK